MTRAEKVLLVALPAALVLTAACRFIQHTDQEYSYWITQYGESLMWLEARCAELRTPGACRAAQDRLSFVAALESHRDRVTAWWWPTLALTVAAWLVAGFSSLPIVKRLLRRRE